MKLTTEELTNINKDILDIIVKRNPSFKYNGYQDFINYNSNSDLLIFQRNTLRMNSLFNDKRIKIRIDNYFKITDINNGWVKDRITLDKYVLELIGNTLLKYGIVTITFNYAFRSSDTNHRSDWIYNKGIGIGWQLFKNY